MLIFIKLFLSGGRKMKIKIICLITMIIVLALAVKIENDKEKQRIHESIGVEFYSKENLW